MLIQSIDETIRYCLGDDGAEIIYEYLATKDMTIQDIPKRLVFFATILEELVGPGLSQLPGAYKILEQEIARSFSVKIKIQIDKKWSLYLPTVVEELRKIHEKTKSTRPLVQV